MGVSKVKRTTMGDLWEIFHEYSDRTEVVLGLVEAVGNLGLSKLSVAWERAKLLLTILEQDYPNNIPGVKVYPNAVRPLISLRLWANDVPILLYRDEEAYLLLGRFLRFLGKHEPIEDVKGVVRDFLGTMVNGWGYKEWSLRFDPFLDTLEEGDRFLSKIIAGPLFLYQPYRTLGLMVQYQPTRDLIPVLAAMLRLQLEEQMEDGELLEEEVVVALTHIEEVVERGWSARKVSIVWLLRWVKSDARVLLYLLDLATGVKEKTGDTYPIDELWPD